jgi:signal transduction histidine kinase
VRAIIELCVRDQGRGVDAGELGHIFEPHRHGTDAVGIGLGLARVEAAADRHGGRAEARLGQEGQGLEVRLVLGAVVGWHDYRMMR